MDANNNQGMIRKPTMALSKRLSPLELLVTPVADIYETADAFVIALNMPGATRDTVSITVEPGSLVAKGVVAPLHQDGAALVLSEIPHKSYLREFALGVGVSHENVQALFEDGVLTITVPETEEMKSQNIQIR
jgi:HSP20 family protein